MNAKVEDDKGNNEEDDGAEEDVEDDTAVPLLVLARTFQLLGVVVEVAVVHLCLIVLLASALL